MKKFYNRIIFWKLISKWKKFIPYLLIIFSFIELIVIDIFLDLKRVKIVSNNINLNFEYSYKYKFIYYQ